MTCRATELPTAYRLQYFEDIDSTNSEAMRRVQTGEQPGLWIFADCQNSGRGRNGRDWVSDPGNLYASVILKPDCNLQTSAQLSLVAGIAAFDAVRALTEVPRSAAPGKNLDLGLKWPNDLLLEGKKLGGILLESSSAASLDEILVIVGTGLNLASHPELAETGTAGATNLRTHGLGIQPREALSALAWSTHDWLTIWDNGANFSEIRTEWLQRACGLGETVTVKHGGEVIRGLFDSLDENGALLLDCGEGRLRRITVGDVFLNR